MTYLLDVLRDGAEVIVLIEAVRQLGTRAVKALQSDDE